MEPMLAPRHAAGPPRDARRSSLGTPAALGVLTYALAAALTLVLARSVANRSAAIVTVAAGMTVAALLATLIWLVTASRALAALSHNAARHDEARMLGIIRASMEAIITIDDAQNIVFFNPAAERIFGVTAAEAIGTPLARFIPLRFRTAHAAHIASFGVNGAAEARMDGPRILPGLRANGQEFPLEASISQIEEDAGKLYTVMLRDVTERVDAENALKRSREELRELSANLQNVREEEKQRIARELHDDLGQQLAALKMDLATLEQTLFEVDEADVVDLDIANQLHGMRRVIDTAVASLRRIAADLRPVMLDDLGLVAAIEWLASDFTNRYGIDVVRRIDPPGASYSQQGATALFRIVQEALNNVARHAEASTVELTLHANSTHCLLRIADNGCGAPPQPALNSHEKAFGLIGVRERAHMLGGSVQIDTAQSAGFAITVTFPLQSMRQEQIDP
ncbi:PAS domain S-box protein [Paraburkholderia sp. G-4-1-8]|uniref:PAS domain S-box protein n=1 Tax=Paraburkholderia antibiotica TaxID=2728839 RepID=A0A7X9ZXB3_9BURK|nr:PAS domain S-box protein [Paraburkholderia antibiotica]